MQTAHRVCCLRSLDVYCAFLLLLTTTPWPYCVPLLMLCLSWARYTTSKMTSRSSPHPPNWKLWHPTNGVVFQQRPLYPVLDVARFFTEASSAKEAQPEAIEAETAGVRVQESTGGLRSAFNGLRRDTVVQESRSQTSHTRYTTTSDEVMGAGVQQIRAEEKFQESVNVKVQGAFVTETEAELEPTGSPENHEAPFTPLDYKMPHETFQAARIAKEGSPESYWSYSFYRGPDENNDAKGKVRVHYCRSAHTAEKALQYFEGEKLLGLDLEWSPQANKNSGIRKNISLVQIASQSRVVLLHLALYPGKDEFVTPTLKKLLEDPEITKLGVWINGDCTRLSRFLGIEVRGKFELSHLFKQVKYSASREPLLINKRLVALATQVQDIMGLPMKKDQNVRASDWSQPLDLEQIGYSASDAYAAIQLFAMLNHQREQLDPSPALPFHTEENKPIPIPPGLDIPSEDEALAEDEVADEQEIEAAVESEGSGVGLAAAPRSEGTQVLDQAQIPAVKGKESESTPAKIPPPPKDPRVEAAEEWVKGYRDDCGGKIKAPPAALKAYHIWHSNEDVDCVSLAKMLREPPLQSSSVASYIMSSVHLEKLPYDKARMKTDVMTQIPGDLARKRFFPLWAAVKSSRET